MHSDKNTLIFIPRHLVRHFQFRHFQTLHFERFETTVCFTDDFLQI